MENLKQYLVKWKIDITAKSPEEATAFAIEIQRDPTSEATHFEVIEQATGNSSEVDPTMDGSDICYGCGKVQEYQTMKDVDETFAIYCDPCHTKEVAKIKLQEISDIIESNIDVDWHGWFNPTEEFIMLNALMKNVLKDLGVTK